MFLNDEGKGFHIPLPPFMSNPNNSPSSSYSINSSRFGIIPNPNDRFSPNIHTYIPLQDLPSFNLNHLTPPPSTSPTTSPNEVIQEFDEENARRRAKRMMSNRESARRSRLRKRKQLETLQSQVLQLLAANHQLAEKLNQVMESNYQILQENARLREEALSLRKSVADLLVSMKGDTEEQEDNAAQARANQIITGTVDVIK